MTKLLIAALSNADRLHIYCQEFDRCGFFKFHVELDANWQITALHLTDLSNGCFQVVFWVYIVLYLSSPEVMLIGGSWHSVCKFHYLFYPVIYLTMNCVQACNFFKQLFYSVPQPANLYFPGALNQNTVVRVISVWQALTTTVDGWTIVWAAETTGELFSLPLPLVWVCFQRSAVSMDRYFNCVVLQSRSCVKLLRKKDVTFRYSIL